MTVHALRNPRKALALFRTRTKQRMIEWAGRSPLASRFYYAFVDPQLVREAMAVAAGQTRYRHDLSSNQESYALLRRNVHRLEKGLIMRPRRAVFALDYMPETVAVYLRAHAANAGERTPELAWAHDVLAHYFDVVDPENPVVARNKDLFERAESIPPGEGEVPSVPYRRAIHEPPSVSIEAFEALCRRRRSVRWFNAQPVPRPMIDRAVAAASQAPSACNRQPFRFEIFDDPARVQEIAGIPMGTRGFVHQMPAVAVLVGQLRCYPYARDRHVIYIDGALAAMSFIFALETMGLASCAINWPDQEPHESRMRKALNLDDDERVIMLIAFGWPDPEGLVPFSAKKAIGTIRTYENDER